MSFHDIVSVVGLVALAAVVFIGFRARGRIPPSGRDHSQDGGVS